MNTLDEYKKSVIKMFFISIKNDINKWTLSMSNCFQSPLYNGTILEIDLKKQSLYLYNSSDYRKIMIYQLWFLPINLKVWFYVRKVKKHFKQVEKDRKNSCEIDFFKNGLTNLQEKFIKEVRKEKLVNIKKI